MKKQITIIAGANGSGKTTFARKFVEDLNTSFINADDIALKLSPENFEKARVKAGKIFFQELERLTEAGKSFALESTLSGSYLRSWIKRWKDRGYQTTIIYIFVESEEEALDRVIARSKKGGHFIPEIDVRRRYKRSIILFWDEYRNLVDKWRLYFNGKEESCLVAIGEKEEYGIIDDEAFAKFEGLRYDK